MAPQVTYILHEDPISAHCYKIKLTASLLNIPIERQQYSIRNKETRTPFFIENINAFGRIPTLQIGADLSTAKFLPESNAACFYLAETVTESASKLQLIPSDAFERAEMLRWMFFEQSHVEPSIAVVRSWNKYFGLDSEEKRAQLDGKMKAGIQALECMEGHLKGNGKEGTGAKDWFVGEGVTLADIALLVLS